MARSIASPFTLALSMAAAAACTSGVNDGFGTFTGGAVNTSTPMGVTTFEDSEGEDSEDGPSTMGGSADDTMGNTMGTTTVDPGTTTNSEECVPPCMANEMCVLGACVPVDDTTTGPPACNDVPGNYDVCLGPGGAVDTSGCGDQDAICITVGMPPIAGACSVNPCVDTCDCPSAPITGNAPIACGPLTGAENLCYLDCSGGQTCPTGMTCFADLACIWPGDGADGDPYGDCFNNDISTCGLEGICLNDDVMAPTVGVCTESCPNAAACPAAPPGGSAPVTCQDVTGDGANECVIDCSLGSCPTGMTCFSGFLCMWS